MSLCLGQKWFEDECMLVKERDIVWRPRVAYIYKNDDKNEDRPEKKVQVFLGTYNCSTHSFCSYL